MNNQPLRIVDYQSMNLASLSERVVNSVLSDGVCVLPQYFSQSFCQSAVATIDSVLTQKTNKSWHDPIEADARVMGIEALAPELDILLEPLINSVIYRLYGVDYLANFIMAGKLTAKPGNLGSGQGWHRDSVHQNQYKALVYLTDVDKDNGPFEYVMRTHGNRTMAAVERLYGIGKHQNRLSDQEAELLPSNRRHIFCAKAGTLIIANTRAIHRGRPIISGMRYALTTYIWPDRIPKHILPFVHNKEDIVS